MSHVLARHPGPVQEFVATLRRTRKRALVALLAFTAGGAVASNPPVSRHALEALLGPPETRSSGPARRALLVGIDSYENPVRGSGLAPPPGRGFRNLRGAAGDARALAEMLVARFGFPRDDVVMLTDRAATRAAILGNFERLIEGSKPGDTALFYFGGHGSLVPNPASDEPDHLDESLVPADAAQGAEDIRDKELRRLLNRLLDRGVVPTVILDSCHSGSAARGLPTEAEPRALRPAVRAAHDPGPYGPSPEERGALVWSATQNDGLAWETDDADGVAHGAFSWALLQTLREVPHGEPAEETFQRVRARLHAERRNQEPILEGTVAVRRAPLFGVGAVSAPSPPVVAVVAIDSEGNALLEGGSADGLVVGSRLTWKPGESLPVELEVVEVLGVGRAKARRLAPEPTRASSPEPAPAESLAIPSGTLLEISGWAAPEGRRLRVWISSWPGDFGPVEELARSLAHRAAEIGVAWVSDPTADSPTHVLRWLASSWQLLAPGEPSLDLGGQPTAEGVLRHLPRGARFFVQVPLPAAQVAGFEIGSGTLNDGIEPTADPAGAAMLLVGRRVQDRIEYAWLRPDSAATANPSGLPAATPWRSFPESAENPLRQDLYHLRKLQGWLILESPPQGAFAFQLALESARDSGIVPEGETLRGGELYRLTLRTRPGWSPERIRQRHLYVFSIDSLGNSALLFGSKADSNRIPFDPDEPAPPSIRLGNEPRVRIIAPYGRDSYFLLTTDEPLANPWVLEYRGFRKRGPIGRTPLEELLSLTGGTGRRDGNLITPVGWSIEHLSFLSVPNEAEVETDSTPNRPERVLMKETTRK